MGLTHRLAIDRRDAHLLNQFLPYSFDSAAVILKYLGLRRLTEMRDLRGLRYTGGSCDITTRRHDPSRPRRDLKPLSVEFGSSRQFDVRGFCCYGYEYVKLQRAADNSMYEVCVVTDTSM